MNNHQRALYDREQEHSSCGVGFITHKQSQQTHKLLKLSHEALYNIPHRGGKSAQGIGDGAGVNIDLSLNFYRHLLNDQQLELGAFGVANFFYPEDQSAYKQADALIQDTFARFNLAISVSRDVPVNNNALNIPAQQAQLPIKQIIFLKPIECPCRAAFEEVINSALLELEYEGFTDSKLSGFYPLSMSSYNQVYKGRLNSWEVVPYFSDLTDPLHQVSTLFFHTRFSTNTAPATMMAQPFRRMAHNGELNTDKKNRLSEDAIARQKDKTVIFPKGQSDSARLDQTLARRITEDKLDIVTAVLAMMPPAWENDLDIPAHVRDMLEYFSLYEEKNDGPAALIFFDGVRVGARLDRLGLRPLRSVETHEFLAVMSEAGQIEFPAKEVLKRGRIQAGGMICFDHSTGQISETADIMERLAREHDYSSLLAQARVRLSDFAETKHSDFNNQHNFDINSRHVAYSHNQESFKFFLDPMLQHGMEKITAMGFGLAPNALTDEEGGVSRYFSQRFAQVTNPPLDSLRESDGMTLRVALGAKPNFNPGVSRQLVLPSPVIQPADLVKILNQNAIAVTTIDTLYTPTLSDPQQNCDSLAQAIEQVCDQVEQAATRKTGIIILSDFNITQEKAAIPALLLVAAANQRLIQKGLRFNTSLLALTGQAVSTHDIACLLGFGASAVVPLTVYNRCLSLYGESGAEQGLNLYQKAVEKALMKTMGKFGLCTAESYIGGEFFESSFIDTDSGLLQSYFPNISSPVGGATFEDIAYSAAKWHFTALSVREDKQIPMLGLFKERQDGAGHSFGNTAVREYINMTQEPVLYASADVENENQFTMEAEAKEDLNYLDFGYEKRSPEQIDEFAITPAYRTFIKNLYCERRHRPATLRDILGFPVDLSGDLSPQQYAARLQHANSKGNNTVLTRGLTVTCLQSGEFELALTNGHSTQLANLTSGIESEFSKDIQTLDTRGSSIVLTAKGRFARLLALLCPARGTIALSQVQPAHEITRQLASGAMSHGALNANAHEAVAQGTNIAGAMSNSGEGGEHSSRYNTIKSSKIKQFASGRFGVWTGYLADPNLQEIEIKIAQGAKPGEGGQLPAAKVTVEIAAARGGTPGVELISPPPHHDTYSIEDLGQLIHDAKAARVKVVVKLVSSEGIGTIAVGVAKAGADVINVAGNTGGTGAAAVTSLKNTGRAAEIGIAEVHQSLCENGLRDKVVLRCSNAHQGGMDVVKSAILGGDSFEFGTTALMMLKCVMAKNCNVKCPAGLTTNPELYQGDPRALAQYFLNLAHEVREILAYLGYPSLSAIRGQAQLLHLINHQKIVGQLDMTGLLRPVEALVIKEPDYLEADFTPCDDFIEHIRRDFINANVKSISIQGPKLTNRDKTTCGQTAIDIERLLNHQLTPAQIAAHPAIYKAGNGRIYLDTDSITIYTHESAGQSYGAFNNSGMSLVHTGTCNDGVGKGASGGIIAIRSPGLTPVSIEQNVLVGNFALFGATGGQLYIHGEAGDRFGVRNSGAVAVVEGVGDFCCEYMTNGSILNLGSFGKGFGNGMSGGIAYQYDPNNTFTDKCNLDSVILGTFDNPEQDTEFVQGLESELKLLLARHAERALSLQAKFLLENWPKHRHQFKYVLPKPLVQSQSSEYIAKANNRKQMLEEYSQAITQDLVRQVTQAYKSQSSLCQGKTPEYGHMDTPLIFQMINTSGVLRRAYEYAQALSPELEADKMDALTKKLLVNQDRKLFDSLVKDVKEALSSFDENEFSILLAAKRVNDYKSSLKRRDVWDNHSLGTTAWIIYRDQLNQRALASLDSPEQKIAAHFTQLFSEVARTTAGQHK